MDVQKGRPGLDVQKNVHKGRPELHIGTVFQCATFLLCAIWNVPYAHFFCCARFRAFLLHIHLRRTGGFCGEISISFL